MIFIWTLFDAILSNRVGFYLLYATHWLLLLSVTIYLIFSYIITLLIHSKLKLISIENKELQNQIDNVPSLTELGLYKFNKIINFLQNITLSPTLMLSLIFWMIIFPNLYKNTYKTDIQFDWYDIVLEIHIHGVIPLLLIFDITFSSRNISIFDTCQPLILGIIYCVWTYIIYTKKDVISYNNTYLYSKYYYYEINNYWLWLILNLVGIIVIHLVSCYFKGIILKNYLKPIQLSHFNSDDKYNQNTNTMTNNLTNNNNNNGNNNKPRKKKKTMHAGGNIPHSSKELKNTHTNSKFKSLKTMFTQAVEVKSRTSKLIPYNTRQ